MTPEQMATALRDAGYTVQAPPTPTQVMEQHASVAGHYARCMAEKIDALIPYVDADTPATDWTREKVTEAFVVRAALDRLEDALKARDARKPRKQRRAA